MEYWANSPPTPPSHLSLCVCCLSLTVSISGGGGVEGQKNENEKWHHVHVHKHTFTPTSVTITQSLHGSTSVSSKPPKLAKKAKRLMNVIIMQNWPLTLQQWLCLLSSPTHPPPPPLVEVGVSISNRDCLLTHLLNNFNHSSMEAGVSILDSTPERVVKLMLPCPQNKRLYVPCSSASGFQRIMVCAISTMRW